MPSTVEAQIKGTIQSFVSELDQLIRKNTLDSLRAALEGNAPVRRGAGRREVTARPKGSSLVESIAPAILAHMKANDGQTVGEIVKAVGAAPKAAKVAIAELIESGQLRKTGQRRGTRYHVGSGRPGAVAKAKPGKRGGRSVTKAKVYDQARIDLLASL